MDLNEWDTSSDEEPSMPSTKNPTSQVVALSNGSVDHTEDVIVKKKKATGELPSTRTTPPVERQRTPQPVTFSFVERPKSRKDPSSVQQQRKRTADISSDWELPSMDGMDVSAIENEELDVTADEAKILDMLSKKTSPNDIKPRRTPSPATPAEPPSVDQWCKWLDLDPNRKDDVRLMYIAKVAARRPVAYPWEQRGQRYYNMALKKYQSEHPYLASFREQLSADRVALVSESSGASSVKSHPSSTPASWKVEKEQLELHVRTLEKSLEEVKQQHAKEIEKIEQRCEDQTKAAYDRCDAVLTQERKHASTLLESRMRAADEQLAAERRAHKEELASTIARQATAESMTTLMGELQKGTSNMRGLQEKMEQEQQMLKEVAEKALQEREQRVAEREAKLEKEREDLRRMMQSVDSTMKDADTQRTALQKAVIQETERTSAQQERVYADVALERQRSTTELELARKERQQLVRERDQWMEEEAQRRRYLATLQAEIDETKTKLEEHQRVSSRQLFSVEKQEEEAKSRIRKEAAALNEEIEALRTAKKLIEKERVQLDQERLAFSRETAALTQVGMEVQRKSEEAARLHEESARHRLEIEAITKELDAKRAALQRTSKALDERERLLRSAEERFQRERVQIARERAMLSERRLASPTIDIQSLLDKDSPRVQFSMASPKSSAVFQREEPKSSYQNEEGHHWQQLQKELDRWSGERETARHDLEDQAGFILRARAKMKHAIVPTTTKPLLTKSTVSFAKSFAPLESLKETHVTWQDEESSRLHSHLATIGPLDSTE